MKFQILERREYRDIERKEYRIMIVVIFEPSLGALSGESPSDLRDAIRNRREVHHTEERSDIVVLQYWQGS